MSIVNICESIKCPYFGDKKYYGCQRYTYSCRCHLRYIQEFPSTEYILYVQEPESANIKALQTENNRFFLEDPKYKTDLDFQESHPDWFEGDCFKVKPIDEGAINP